MIGPSFQQELAAAGLTDWRLSWGADGELVFHPEMAQEQIDIALAVLAAHNADTMDPDQPERDAQHVLAADARADAIFQALQTATPAQISAYINNQFGGFTGQQRAVVKLLLQVAALLLRRGVI